MLPETKARVFGIAGLLSVILKLRSHNTPYKHAIEQHLENISLQLHHTPISHAFRGPRPDLSGSPPPTDRDALGLQDEVSVGAQGVRCVPPVRHGEPGREGHEVGTLRVLGGWKWKGRGGVVVDWVPHGLQGGTGRHFRHFWDFWGSSCPTKREFGRSKNLEGKG